MAASLPISSAQRIRSAALSFVKWMDRADRGRVAVVNPVDLSSSLYLFFFILEFGIYYSTKYIENLYGFSTE